MNKKRHHILQCDLRSQKSAFSPRQALQVKSLLTVPGVFDSFVKKIYNEQNLIKIWFGKILKIFVFNKNSNKENLIWKLW